AVILVQYENSQRLWKNGDDNWMRYLFDKLSKKEVAPSLDDFGRLAVSFVTFNYDRSLEHFLCKSLQSRYAKPEAECAPIVDRMVIHVHGRLGYLPWQTGTGQRQYEAVLTRDVLEMCVESIKIMDEDLPVGPDSDFERVHVIMQKADAVYYLGFGYGDKN